MSITVVQYNKLETICCFLRLGMTVEEALATYEALERSGQLAAVLEILSERFRNDAWKVAVALRHCGMLRRLFLHIIPDLISLSRLRRAQEGARLLLRRAFRQAVDKSSACRRYL